jgi:putative membrane protein
LLPAWHGPGGERRAQKIASQKGWTLPTEPTAEQKAKKAKLEKLSGAAFDKEYADTMVTNHRNNLGIVH